MRVKMRPEMRKPFLVGLIVLVVFIVVNNSLLFVFGLSHSDWCNVSLVMFFVFAALQLVIYRRWFFPARGSGSLKKTED